MSISSGTPIRILHVEDDPPFAEITAEHLENELDAARIDSVTNPDDCLERLQAEDFDCVVSDFDLPERNGIELLERVRSDHPELPFILFTGKGSEEVASEAISAGVTDYLQKGSGQDQYTLLANRIANAVDQRRATLQLDRYEDRLEVLLEDSHDIITVVDDQGWVQYVSPAVERILDYTIEEFLDKRFMDLVHPQDRDGFNNLASGSNDSTSSSAINRHDYRIQTAGGNWRWMETIWRPKWHDVVDGIVMNTRDITERKSTYRRFQEILEHSTDVTAVLDDEGTFQYVSPALESVFDFDSTELEGRDALEYIHPDDRERLRREFDRIIENPEYSPVIEHRFKTRDGSWRWLETTGNNQLSNPEIEGIVFNSREITDRREQRQKVDRYERLLEALPVGVSVLDDEANIQWVNEAFWTAIDKSEEEVTGLQFLKLIEEGYLEPEIADDYLAAVRTLLSSENDADRAVIEFQVDPPHEDGIREYEGYLALQPLDNGQFNGTVNAFLDVTERNRREREMEQYKATMETVPDGVFLLDEVGTMIQVNEAWASTVGYDRTDLVGAPFTKLVDDGVIDRENIDTYLQLLQELLSSSSEKERGKFRTRVTPPDDDSEHVYEVHIGLLPYDDEFQGAAGVVRDITERVQRQRQLEQENERLEEFASIVSHDLKNPLNVASVSLEAAEESGDADHFDRCRTAIDRMDQLIDDLLSLAQQGRQIEDPDILDLASVARQSWQSVETDGSSITIATDHHIKADEGRLKQLFENLLQNAAHHGGESVSITVGDLPDGKGFYVEDDGSGISADERADIFDSGYTTSKTGTGFGLSIVEEIVDAHDWAIAVTEGPSGGARFEVTGITLAA